MMTYLHTYKHYQFDLVLIQISTTEAQLHLIYTNIFFINVRIAIANNSQDVLGNSLWSINLV